MRRWRVMILHDWHATPRDRRLAIIVAASKEGLSATQIALHRFTGATRSAILGAAQRGGVSLGGKAPKKADGIANATKRLAPKAAGAPLAPALAMRAEQPPQVEQASAGPASARSAADASVTLLEAGPHQCRWPMWPDGERDPSRHVICAALAEGPYCAAHTERSIDQTKRLKTAARAVRRAEKLATDLRRRASADARGKK